MTTANEGLDRLFQVSYQFFIIFPYNALTTARQRALPDPLGRMRRPERTDEERRWEEERDRDVGEALVEMCRSGESVSSLMAKEPGLTPGDAWKRLYGGGKLGRKSVRSASDAVPGSGTENAAACGKWGPTMPGELFLEMYKAALKTVEEDPENALVSPPLMGGCGVVPLTVISTIPDIARHMSNLIVRAEKEVIIATNYWGNGVASRFLTNALRELSRRAGERGERAVVKIIYDRGSVRQLVEPHYLVPEWEFSGKAVGIPKRDEIPNVDLEVMNYHHPMLGTFHSKFMVVDRRIALLQSNNIQDNDNLEMMVHLEGPIVDAVYDMALVSWHRKMDPPLPSRNTPAAEGGLESFSESHAGIFGPKGTIGKHHVVVDPGRISFKKAFGPDAEGDPERADVVTGQTTTESTTHPVNGEHAATSHGSESRQPPDPIGSDEKTDGYLAKGDQILADSQIQHPSEAANPLPEHTVDDPHYDADIAGEVARVQSAVSPHPPSSASRMAAVTRLLNHTTNADFTGTAPECPPHEEMTPYVPHPAHEAVPMALVCRPPHGKPTNGPAAARTPQNEAWLAALRCARKNVFIQSPTLNAEPLVPAIAEACERGVDVYCYICLGYNDAGELLPMQGGHNELVSNHLHASLSDSARKRLHFFWYVGKDETRPIPQEHHRRSCHIKLMIADERVAIVGSGNQDTQSWFHSQEVNVMVDSPELCRTWIDALRRNQNTHQYGAVDRKDGVWRDHEGREVEGAMGVDPGRFSWAFGLFGAVKRFQGKGGFG